MAILVQYQQNARYFVVLSWRFFCFTCVLIIAHFRQLFYDDLNNRSQWIIKQQQKRKDHDLVLSRWCAIPSKRVHRFICVHWRKKKCNELRHWLPNIESSRMCQSTSSVKYCIIYTIHFKCCARHSISAHLIEVIRRDFDCGAQHHECWITRRCMCERNYYFMWEQVKWIFLWWFELWKIAEKSDQNRKQTGKKKPITKQKSYRKQFKLEKLKTFFVWFIFFSFSDFFIYIESDHIHTWCVRYMKPGKLVIIQPYYMRFIVNVFFSLFITQIIHILLM